MRRLKINLLFLVALSVFFSISLSQAQNIYAINTKPVARYAGIGNLQPDDKNEKNKLINVLKELNRIKGVYFMFSNQALSTVTVNPVTDMQQEVEAILSQMFKNTGLAYKKINAKTFVIISANDASKSKAEIRNQGYALMIPNSNERPVKNTAQADVVTGKIVDKTGAPLAGVSVSVKGKSRGTSTDANGSFSIEAGKGDVLIFTSVGYEMQEVTVRNNNNFSIKIIYFLDYLSLKKTKGKRSTLSG